MDAVKVLIFAVWEDRLLVFDEPDFPDVPLQVPGGTVEDGEEPALAAEREFREETGLEPGSNPEPIFSHDYCFERNGQAITHRRHYFLTRLSGSFPEDWIHWEEKPFDGGEPIRFRLHWIKLGEASKLLGLGMGAAIALLP